MPSKLASRGQMETFERRTTCSADVSAKSQVPGTAASVDLSIVMRLLVRTEPPRSVTFASRGYVDRCEVNGETLVDNHTLIVGFQGIAGDLENILPTGISWVSKTMKEGSRRQSQPSFSVLSCNAIMIA